MSATLQPRFKVRTVQHTRTVPPRYPNAGEKIVDRYYIVDYTDARGVWHEYSHPFSDRKLATRTGKQIVARIVEEQGA